MSTRLGTRRERTRLAGVVLWVVCGGDEGVVEVELRIRRALTDGAAVRIEQAGEPVAAAVDGAVDASGEGAR